jgi:hypothetical protein
MCNGQCVDTTSDSSNCGTCSKSCVYGMCSSSKCQAWTVAGDGQGGGYATDGTWLAYNDGTDNVREIKANGTGALANPVGGVLSYAGSGPVMSGATVAWLGSGISIYTAPEGAATGAVGGTFPGGYLPSYLALNPSATIAFVFAQKQLSPWGTYLYGCTLNGSACNPLNSGNPIETPTGSSANYPTNLLVNANSAFWTYNYSGSTYVRSLNFATNAIASTTTQYAGYLTIDASNIYWEGSPNYTVYRAAQNNLASPTAVTSVALVVGGLASDGTNVYVGTSNLSGAATLYYAPVGGSSATAQVLYTSQYATGSAIGAIVTAGGAVYFEETDESQCPPATVIRGVAAP